MYEKNSNTRVKPSFKKWIAVDTDTVLLNVDKNKKINQMDHKNKKNDENFLSIHEERPKSTKKEHSSNN